MIWTLFTAFLVGLASAPIVGRFFRPLAKEVVKGGLIVADAASGVVSQARGNMDSMVDTARSELNARKAAKIAVAKP
jgi:hypothetical protein